MIENLVESAEVIYDVLNAKRMSISNERCFLWAKVDPAYPLGVFEKGKEIPKNSFAYKSVEQQKVVSGEYFEETTQERMHVYSYPIFQAGKLEGALTFGVVDTYKTIYNILTRLANLSNDFEVLLKKIEKQKEELKVAQDEIGSHRKRLHTIEEISDKTKVLGLNASIEANRNFNPAFEIISSEISKLSDTTRDAAKLIQKNMSPLLKMTENNILLFEEMFNQTYEMKNIAKEVEKEAKTIIEESVDNKSYNHKLVYKNNN